MLILSCIIWEIDRKSLDKNEVENLTNFVEVWLFKIFLKLPGYKPCIFERKCMPVSFLWFWHHAMCDFPVITRFGFRSLCDNGIRSRSVPFHFGWRILPCCPWGEKVPWLCVGQAAAYAAKRPHAREVLFDALSLLPMGGEKNLENIGEAAVHGAKSLHTREDNIMPVVNRWIPSPIYVVVWCIGDNLPYVIYYGFENYIISAHRLLYIVSWYYFEKLCVSSFNHSCHIIIENDLVGLS